jgi:hypothetical protein
MDFSKYRFSIIHHFSSPKEAITLDGYKVERQDKLFVLSMGEFVACPGYDNHFVYEDPLALKPIKDGGKPRWVFQCTCGSPAVIVGANAYKNDSSPIAGSTVAGKLLVCYHHARFHKHADGSS